MPDSTVPPLPAGLTTNQILDALTDGVYVTDLDRRIVYWSKAAERLTGWSAEEVLGRHCRDGVLDHTDKDGRCLCGCDHCPLHRAICSGERSTVPIIVFGKRKDGTRLASQVSVAPIRNEAGETVGGVEVFRDLSRLMVDLDRAQRLQRDAMQNEASGDGRLAVDVHYVPNDIIGGDFYTIGRTGPDGYAILLADVMGHGTAAALYTMYLRVLWEQHRHLAAEPDRILAAIGNQLHPLASGESAFATAVALHLNVATGELSWAGAGHPNPFLFRGDGTVEQLGCAGLPLGIFAEAGYERSACRLMPGETLLAYTDGAVEVDDRNGVQLGEEGLEALLVRRGFPSRAVSLASVEADILAYSAGIRLPDDLTLLRLSLARR